MSLKKIIKTFAITTLLTLSAVPVVGQDLLARQAPVDRRMKTVDTLMLRNITAREEMENPAAELYEDWNNTFAHRATALPETYRINLKHFCMPTQSRVVTSNFGPRWGRQHKGLDIKVYIGDTIRAAFSGKVRIVRYEAAGYGKYIVIRHPNGLETIYGHLTKALVKPEQTVRAGQPIALGGNTGRSTGPHLHFETRYMGYAINPSAIFDFANRTTHTDTYTFSKKTYTQPRNYAPKRNVLAKTDGNSYHAASNTQSTYTVKRGDTLSSIARSYGMSATTLRRLNKLSHADKIQAGQVLKLK